MQLSNAEKLMLAMLCEIHEASNPPHVTHVLDVLDMWSIIEDSYAALTPDETARYAAETGHTYDPQFPGFHGHSESDEHSAARFLIDQMGRFSTFAGRNPISDQPTIPRSRRMLATFAPIRTTLGNRDSARLTADEIIAVIKA